jgi:hypothetical protein
MQQEQTLALCICIVQLQAERGPEEFLREFGICCKRIPSGLGLAPWTWNVRAHPVMLQG